jgi:hypothetical protein
MIPPASRQTSQSLPIVELLQAGYSSHIAGISQALDTEIDAWRTCKDNTAILPSALAFDFEKLQAYVGSCSQEQVPFLGKYLFDPGSLQLPRSTQLLTATASATCLDVSIITPDACGKEQGVPTQDGSAKAGAEETSNGASNCADVIVKFFVRGVEQFTSEKRLWEREDVAREMASVIEFVQDNASEASPDSNASSPLQTSSAIVNGKDQRPSDAAHAVSTPVPCVVMEKGISLHKWMKKKRRSVAEALEVLCAVTESLERLHRLGLAHRNIKPSNILWLPRQEKWTLCDFGCAAKIGGHLSGNCLQFQLMHSKFEPGLPCVDGLSISLCILQLELA